MSVRKGNLRGVSKNMLRLRLRIKSIKGSSGDGRETVDRLQRSEPVESMVQRLRLGCS